MNHYFSTAPAGPERRRTVPVRLWQEDLRFEIADGVFAGDGLDLGTSVLLRASAPPTPTPGGRLLDLGCGWGPIAVALARHCPGATVDAVDVNPRARDLCQTNAERLGVADRIRVRHPDDVPPEARYDAIWSNPPIRIGKDALHELLLGWLARLTPTGEARLVVARHLGADSLQRWLITVGYRCERVASAKGFRVLTVQRGA